VADEEPTPRCEDCGEELRLRNTGRLDEQGEPVRDWVCVTVTCPGSGVI
jgi:hypothetical protein